MENLLRVTVLIFSLLLILSILGFYFSPAFTKFSIYMSDSYAGDVYDATNPSDNPDPGKVAWWLHIAAERGDRKAQSRLAQLFQEGRGVQQDYAEAAKWSRKAAEQGDITAPYSLCHYYRDGKGVKQDYSEALKWCEVAADYNLGNAQIEVANFYLNGLGAPRSDEKAYYWISLANYWSVSPDDLGYSPEQKANIGQRLTVEKRHSIDEEVRKWSPKPWPEWGTPEDIAHCTEMIAEKRKVQPISDDVADQCLKRCSFEIRPPDQRFLSLRDCPYWSWPHQDILVQRSLGNTNDWP